MGEIDLWREQQPTIIHGYDAGKVCGSFFETETAKYNALNDYQRSYDSAELNCGSYGGRLEVSLEQFNLEDDQPCAPTSDWGEVSYSISAQTKCCVRRRKSERSW